MFLILKFNADASKVHIGNEYCQVNVDGALIYWRPRIGNRELGIGNRERVPSSMFLVKIVYVSNVHIGSKEPDPCSFFNYVGFIFV